jgi:hypothetical protein
VCVLRAGVRAGMPVRQNDLFPHVPVSNNMTMNLVTIAHGGLLPLKVYPLASELKNPQ